MKRLIVLGVGGHCQSVLDSLNSQTYEEIVGIDLEENIGKSILGVKVCGGDKDILDFYKRGFTDAFITLGTIGNTIRRRALYQELKKIGFEIPNIVDPSAIVSRQASLGEGVFLGKGAIINSGAKIGNCCIINTRASVDHGTLIEDFVNISPGSCISGDVKVGCDTHIGTGSSIIQGIHIGSNTMIGAGSVVVKHIPENVIAFGCPCKVRRLKE